MLWPSTKKKSVWSGGLPGLPGIHPPVSIQDAIFWIIPSSLLDSDELLLLCIYCTGILYIPSKYSLYPSPPSKTREQL
jgi:hypothetical protein